MRITYTVRQEYTYIIAITRESAQNLREKSIVVAAKLKHNRYTNYNTCCRDEIG